MGLLKKVTSGIKKATGIDLGRPTAENAIKRQTSAMEQARKTTQQVDYQGMSSDDQQKLKASAASSNPYAPTSEEVYKLRNGSTLTKQQLIEKYPNGWNSDMIVGTGTQQVNKSGIKSIEQLNQQYMGDGSKFNVNAATINPAAQMSGQYGTPTELNRQGITANVNTKTNSMFGADKVSSLYNAMQAGQAGELDIQAGQAGGFQDTRRSISDSDRTATMDVLGSAMRGEAPSQASMMMQQGMEQAQMQRAAQMAANPNMNPALAAKFAQSDAAQSSAQAAQQAAMLRAQEMSQARGQFADAAQGFRGQDVSLAGQDLQASQADLGARQFDTQQQMQASQANQQTSLQQMLANQQSGMQAQELRGQQDQFNAQQQASARLAAGQDARAAVDQQAQMAQFNAQQNMGASQADMAAQQQAAQMRMQADQTNVGAQNQNAQLAAQLQQQANMQNSANQMGIAQTGFAADMQRAQDIAAAQQNQFGNTMAAQQLINQNAMNKAGTELSNVGNQIGVGNASLGNYQAAQASSNQMLGAFLQAGASGAAMMSDIRSKDNIKSNKRDLAKFLATIKPKSFSYKAEAPVNDHGRHDGFMAQDIEKSEIGKNLVSEIGGYKQINAAKALMATMSSLGYLNDKIKKLEKK